MLSQLFSRLVRQRTSSNSKRPQSMFEPLEGRTHLSVTLAHATTIQFDNRGEGTIKVSKPLQAATVTTKTCKMFTAGKDNKLNTADDVLVNATVGLNKSKTIITMRANLKADTAYRVQLLSNSIKDTDGLELDGEFNGNGLVTGNGVQGGTMNFRVRPTTGALPIAQFYTNYGNIDVSLYRGATASNSAAPTTVAHFIKIANAGAYDNQVVTRSDSAFVVQWGGVTMDPKTGGLSLTTNPTKDVLTDEVGTNSNVRGTISYALSGGPETAGLEFFFNVANNSFLDTAQGGSGPFSPFGKIKNAASQAVVDAINGLNRLDFTGTGLDGHGVSVTQWPVNASVAVTGDTHATGSNGGTTTQTLNFLNDFVSVRRVAILGTISKL